MVRKSLKSNKNSKTNKHQMIGIVIAVCASCGSVLCVKGEDQESLLSWSGCGGLGQGWEQLLIDGVPQVVTGPNCPQ